ncbi:hypothetical protein TDB9533_01822 [Thalassocella blandensis]|nr:hypothetical protein TDB9533_01822 [Thalassocella blandensis]
MRKAVVILGALIGLQTGCATMNKADCLSADWQAIGEKDALVGYNESRMDLYQKACLKHEITPDYALYKQGHYVGSQTFCTAQNGFNRAREGFEYQQSCPLDLETEFLQGYHDGWELYRIKLELDEVEHEISSAHKSIASNETQMEEKHDQMFADGMTKEMRSHLMSDIDRLNDANKILDSQIMVLQGRYADLQENYENAEKELDVYN